MAEKNIEDLRHRIDNLEFLCIYLIGAVHDLAPPDVQKSLASINADFIQCAGDYGSEMPDMSQFKSRLVDALPKKEIIIPGNTEH